MPLLKGHNEVFLSGYFKNFKLGQLIEDNE